MTDAIMQIIDDVQSPAQYVRAYPVEPCYERQKRHQKRRLDLEMLALNGRVPPPSRVIGRG